MSELPFHVQRNHLCQIGRSDFIVQRGPAFRFVERAANRSAREFRAEIMIEPDKTIEPMQPVTVEGAAHVKKDRANQFRRGGRNQHTRARALPRYLQIYVFHFRNFLTGDLSGSETADRLFAAKAKVRRAPHSSARG